MEKGHQIQSTYKELLFEKARLQKRELQNERKSKTLLFPWILNFSSVPYPEAELRANGVTWLWDLALQSWAALCSISSLLIIAFVVKRKNGHYIR